MAKAQKKIAIVGSCGSMGLWFTKYFVAKGFAVSCYDIKGKTPVKDVKQFDSLVGAILNVEYVLLCTPTRRTPEIIRLISKEMQRESYLIEISSQKVKTASALSKIPAKVSPICIHPMFGSSVKKLTGRNIICIPIKDAKKELTVTRSLFEDANFVTVDAVEHDKKVAVILGLTHMMNLAFANILAKDDKTSLTEKMSGITFKAQKMVAESILTESPELIETIIANPELRRIAEEFWKDIGRMLTSVQEGKTEEITDYVKACKEQIVKHSDINDSYKRLTAMMKAPNKK